MLSLPFCSKLTIYTSFKDEIDFLFYLVMLLYSWKTVFSIYFSHKGIFFLLLLYCHPKAISLEYSLQDRAAHIPPFHLDIFQSPEMVPPLFSDKPWPSPHINKYHFLLQEWYLTFIFTIALAISNSYVIIFLVI